MLTLNDLSEAWNQLRNAALGRGTEPLVSAGLAADVADAHERFRVWLGEQGTLDDLIASVQAGPWIDLHRALAERVRAEGRSVPGLDPSTKEQAEDVLAYVGKAAIAVIAVAAGVAAWAMARGSR